VLTAHIIISVGLLVDSAGFLAVAIRTAMADDPRTVLELVNVLITGVVLGLGTRWGVFRYPWVTAKLLLILSVMVVGGACIGPAETALRYDVLALALATALGVFKPGGPFRRAECLRRLSCTGQPRSRPSAALRALLPLPGNEYSLSR
jgi:hypothetical protein